MAEATPPAPSVKNSGKLRYADPRDLPSFPSSGLRPDGAAAGAAATLGWHNQKPVELWKPDKLSSASAAAVLAKDYKMAPAWEPASDSAGHKAALLAVGSASSALKSQPSSSPKKDQHEGWGNSAAVQAFHAQRPSSAQKSDLSHGSSAATQAFNVNRSQSTRKAQAPSPSNQADRSLLAAQGAMSSNRPRAISSPSAPSAQDSKASHSRAASNALNGATIAHRASMASKLPSEDAGAVPVTTMTRNMFTSHPMVKPEVDEQQNNEKLHQSAVEMAKKMYSQQQKMLDQTKEHGREGEKGQASTYLNLQDAAYKQAQERLSKLQDEHQKTREFQEYYGNTQAPRRRWSVTNRLRRKTSDDDFEDREQSEKIRQQMSMFSNKLTEVDQTKRQHDREALMAAAQRNVKAQLHGMDEKVYNKTGKVNPTLLSDWELKAQEAARGRHESNDENKGKLDLGGGMFMDPDQVDAIASKRMQPVLDDINEKAEQERERQAALRMEEEDKKAELEREREREREIKEMNKRIKDDEKQEEKLKRQQAKEDEKAKKEQEKLDKAEQKRLAKEEKRRSKHDSAVVAEDYRHDQESPQESSTAVRDEATQADGTPEAPANEEPHHATAAAVAPAIDTNVGAGSPEAEEQQHTPDEQHSPSKVKDWIKNRFARGKSVSEHEETPEKTDKSDKRRSFFHRGDHEDEAEKSEKRRGFFHHGHGSDHEEKTDKSEKRRSFFRGGAALKKNPQPDDGTASLEQQRSSSIRDVALAGKDEHQGEAVDAGPSVRRDSRGVSPVSSAEDLTESRSRKDKDVGLMPPKPFGDSAPRSSISPNRDSRFREEMDQ